MPLRIFGRSEEDERSRTQVRLSDHDFRASIARLTSAMIDNISPFVPSAFALARSRSGVSSCALAFEISLMTCPSFREMYRDFKSAAMGFNKPEMTFLLLNERQIGKSPIGPPRPIAGKPTHPRRP